MKKTLIVQGGGFRTGFTAGILDAFLVLDYCPFDQIIGNSGGAISASYYLAKQYGSCVEAMRLLAKDPDFVNVRGIIRDRGYMNIDHLRSVADDLVPFDLNAALENTKNRDVFFVATNRLTGEPFYLSPKQPDWIEVVIASSTLPFVTKGVHKVRDLDLMDGGWSDPIPVKWAVEQGAKDILVLRTTHIDRKVVQSWPDYFGSIYFRSHPELSACFANNHLKYNNVMDYLSNPPEDTNIEQLWPEDGLKCSTYSYSVEGINSDYRYGVQMGMDYVKKSLRD
ncbi:MAG: patatin family protein [Crocinitomicaceae bacterium]|nr:patatin family protein [Crocinitomicaceae bacterium]